MKRILSLAAFLEIATGLALLVVPSFVEHLLLGAEIAGVALAMARVLGIALVGLGVACWPAWNALYGMLVYSSGVALFLAYLGLSGGFGGVLLWPAVGAHAVLTALLVRAAMLQGKLTQ